MIQACLASLLLVCAIVFSSNRPVPSSNLMVEICNNLIDDDGDGLIDCMDGDCQDSDDCTLAKELPFPSVNLNLFPAGTLIIPMDL